MSILILSEDADYHGVAVRWGLQRLGMPVIWWPRSNFPGKQTATLFQSNGAETVCVDGRQIGLPGELVSVWNRRGRAAKPRLTLDPTDFRVASLESNALLTAALENIIGCNPRALVVNHQTVRETAEAKMHQLHVARRCGFKIPDTLASNDPNAIREFIRQHNNRCVVKLQHPFVWRPAEGTPRRLYTSSIEVEDLRDDASISACPMIYQERIDWRYELRITCFGSSAFCARREPANRDRYGEAVIDIGAEDVRLYPYELPSSIAIKCFSYMSMMGIVYAAFDVAVNGAGHYVFIEANQSGQFLFKEDYLPEIPLLDAFCKFLASGDPQYSYDGSVVDLRLSEFDVTEEAAQVGRIITDMMNGAVVAPFELRE